MDEKEIVKWEHKYNLDNIDTSSLLNWYPWVKDLVPTPRTEIVKLKRGTSGFQDIPCTWDLNEVKAAIDKVGGYPVFIRTDLASNKHEMARGSKVECEEDLNSHIANVIEFNEIAGFLGLPYTCLVVREWLDLWQPDSFMAFDGTVIGKEIRFFINEQDVACWHYYWPEDSIRFFNHNKIVDKFDNPSKEDLEVMDEITLDDIEEAFETTKDFYESGPDNWQDKLRKLRVQSMDDVMELLPEIQKVASQFEDYWSVDFAQASDGTWYLIDMAVGIESWHPDCEIRDSIIKKLNK